MRLPSMSHLTRLTLSDLELLTQLLSLRTPNPSPRSWLRDQAHLISSLPTNLLRRKSLFRYLVKLSPFAEEKARLCETHKPLNPQLIRRIFIQVIAECSTHLLRLMENPSLPENIVEHAKRMQMLHGFCVSFNSFPAASNGSLSTTCIKKKSSGCEACILATVGGSHRFLSDLRASMIGRKKADRKSPRLLPFVDAWIYWTGRHNEIFFASAALGRELRRTRREIPHIRVEDWQYPLAASRHREMDEYENTLSDEEDRESSLISESAREDSSDEGHHFEMSIIDFYANLASMTSLHASLKPSEDMPASQESIVFDQAAGTFGRKDQPSSVSRPRHTFYMESVYSQPERASTPSQPHPRTSLSRDMERRAQAYKKLIEVVDEETPTRESSRNNRNAAHRPKTRTGFRYGKRNS